MRSARVAVLALLLLSALPMSAVAAQTAVLLGFAASYTAPDGTSRTHHGVDLAMPSGSDVTAPVDGTVRFVGSVPSAAGGTVKAVSIDVEGGTLTLLPLESAAVSPGQRLETGETVGSVAASGDPSSAGSHVHIGLKRGGLYVDPTELLAAVAPVPSQQPAPQSVPVPRPEKAAQTEPAAVPSARAGQAPAISGAAQPAPSAAVPSSVPQMEPTAGPATAPGVSLAPGVSIAPAPAAPDEAVGPVVTAAPRTSRAPAASGEPVPAPSARVARGLVAPAIAAFAAALFCSLLLVTRRAFARRIDGRGPVSDRLGTLLQHLKAGDTLCGLTSCSGPLPSQSRGH